MKTIDTVIFSLCIGFFIIAIYETIMLGISYSYPWFMVSSGLLLYYSYRRRSQEEKEKKEDSVRKRGRSRE